MTDAEKLDRVIETTTDIRLAVATLHGEVRTSMERLDRHEAAAERDRLDLEVRLRAVERRVWALPSIATVLGVLSLAVAAWAAWAQ